MDPETGKEIDPREELVNRLIEYKKFKEATEALRLLEQDRQNITKRGNALHENEQIRAQHQPKKHRPLRAARPLFRILFHALRGLVEKRLARSLAIWVS
ncbi:MAG: segregation/condensation protein A [Bacteroidetes bacterium]|nr:segregation/condensation protein A [Bacteroidota bacterium]